MTRDPDRTHTILPAEPPTESFDAALEAGLAVAFAPDPVSGAWSRPPLLRDDPSDHAPVVRPDSPDMPRADPGRYQLLGEIARGGMGVILKGRDPDLGRDLAFKVLKAELAGRPAAEQRFVEEAQVCGQLQHPGVVPVYELGRFADGQPFFTMKLVKGRTLAALLAERSDPAQNRGRFLQDFLKVCQTIAYAHSRGVIHRDLKPANVMVGPFGEVLVMDWGLAKVIPQGGVADEDRASRGRQSSIPDEFTVIQTARSGSVAGSETVAGSVMGTPAFMPPEQAGGEIDKLDERADVFGLGAVLCVVLTGQPPYAGSDGEAVRLLAIRGRVEGAFSRLDGCGADADLVALCKRCLAPERDDRPRHGGEVEAAVAAYLSGVEDRAHRADVDRAAAEVRAAEVRKRRRVQGALGAALLAAVGLVGFGLWWQERQSAAAAADRAARQARTVSSTTAALDDARTRTEEAWAQVDSVDRMQTAANLATAAVQRAEGFVNTGEPTDELWAEVETTRAAITDLNRHVRLLAEGERISREKAEELPQTDPTISPSPDQFAAAFREFGLDPGATPEDQFVRAVVGSRVRGQLLGFLATWHVRAGPDKKKRVEQIIRAVRLAAGGLLARWQAVTDRNDVDGLVELSASPDVMALGPDLITAVGRDLNRAKANKAWLELLRRAYERFPTHRFLRYDLVLACWGHVPPRHAEALRHASAAVLLNPTSPVGWRILGIAYERNQSPDQAIAAYRRVIDLGWNDARSYGELGSALNQTGDYPGGIDAFRKALELAPDYAFAHANLAVALYRTTDYAGALPHYRRAVELAPDTAIYHVSLAGALRTTGDPEGAVRGYRRAVELDPNYGAAHYSLALLLRDVERDNDGAAAHLQKAVDLQPASPLYHEALAGVLVRTKDFVGAEAAARRAIALAPERASAYATLTQALASKGRVAEALRVHTDALRRHPVLGASPANVVQYNAACCAARCAAGQGTDIPPDADRPALRQQALDWLTADLAGWRKSLAADPVKNRDRVHATMRHWLQDADLAAVREPAELDKVPAAERDAWARLWSGVRDLRAETAPPQLGPPPRVVK